MKKRTIASGVYSFEYSAAWNGSTDRMQADEKRIQQIQKKQKAAVRKKAPRKKKGPEIDGLTYESTMDLEYAEGFRYITTKTAIR